MQRGCYEPGDLGPSLTQTGPLDLHGRKDGLRNPVVDPHRRGIHGIRRARMARCPGIPIVLAPLCSNRNHRSCAGTARVSCAPSVRRLEQRMGGQEMRWTRASTRHEPKCLRSAGHLAATATAPPAKPRYCYWPSVDIELKPLRDDECDEEPRRRFSQR